MILAPIKLTVSAGALKLEREFQRAGLEADKRGRLRVVASPDAREGSVGSVETPENAGPRQCGQFSALRVAAATANAAVKTTAGFRMRPILYKARLACKTGLPMPTSG